LENWLPNITDGTKFMCVVVSEGGRFAYWTKLPDLTKVETAVCDFCRVQLWLGWGLTECCLNSQEH